MKKLAQRIQEGKNIHTLSENNDKVYEETKNLFYKEYENFLKEVSTKLKSVLKKIDGEASVRDDAESVIIGNLLTHIQHPSDLNVYKLNLFK